MMQRLRRLGALEQFAVCVFWTATIFRAAAGEACDLGVVGAGAGGAYAAWRAATAGRSVCLFELAGRPGGRIHSLRGQGPRGDLIVEAGAYRFAPKPVYAKFSNFTWKIETPLTAAIVKELGLPIAPYNPNASDWDHGMRKLVDENGHDVGYLTLVEQMLSRAQIRGAKVTYNSPVVSLASRPGEVGLRLASGEEVSVKAVLLNLPQRPLVELLRRSDAPISDVFPRPLYMPMPFPIMKLYVHYDDAWWRNELGLVAGAFFNTEVVSHASHMPTPNQLPTPFQGQYHDGDVRCDGQGGRCRGYLQAYYGGDHSQQPGSIEQGLSYYSVFQDSVSNDSVVHLTQSKAHHRALLADVHASLVDFHRTALDALNATARVARMAPTSAVMSIWGQGVSGIHAGCHEPKGGSNPSPSDLPTAALQPLPGLPIFVANEAYGHMSCFAEGSLSMADAAMKALNISTPEILREGLHADLVPEDAMPVPTDPFLMNGGMALRRYEINGDDISQVMGSSKLVV